MDEFNIYDKPHEYPIQQIARAETLDQDFSDPAVYVVERQPVEPEEPEGKRAEYNFNTQNSSVPKMAGPARIAHEYTAYFCGIIGTFFALAALYGNQWCGNSGTVGLGPWEGTWNQFGGLPSHIASTRAFLILATFTEFLAL